jgi:hypothetical protein
MAARTTAPATPSGGLSDGEVVFVSEELSPRWAMPVPNFSQGGLNLLPETQHTAGDESMELPTTQTTEAELELPEWTSDDESQPITTTESESSLLELEPPDSEPTMKELAQVEPPPKLRRMIKHVDGTVFPGKESRAAARSVLTLFPVVALGQLQGQH